VCTVLTMHLLSLPITAPYRPPTPPLPHTPLAFVESDRARIKFLPLQRSAISGAVDARSR
jgi:hypothetical protein